MFLLLFRFITNIWICFMCEKCIEILINLNRYWDNFNWVWKQSLNLIIHFIFFNKNTRKKDQQLLLSNWKKKTSSNWHWTYEDLAFWNEFYLNVVIFQHWSWHKLEFYLCFESKLWLFSFCCCFLNWNFKMYKLQKCTNGM